MLTPFKWMTSTSASVDDICTLLRSINPFFGVELVIIDMAIKPLGSGGTSDPLNQRATMVVTVVGEKIPVSKIATYFIPGKLENEIGWYSYDR